MDRFHIGNSFYPLWSFLSLLAHSIPVFLCFHKPLVSFLKQIGLLSTDQHSVSYSTTAHLLRGGAAFIDDPINRKNQAVFPPNVPGIHTSFLIHIHIYRYIRLPASCAFHKQPPFLKPTNPISLLLTHQMLLCYDKYEHSFVLIENVAHTSAFCQSGGKTFRHDRDGAERCWQANL